MASEGTSRLFRFPNPVNEVAARTVAAGVVVQCVAVLVLTAVGGHNWFWLTVPLAYGFLARVAAGPTLSPLGRLATQVVAPRLGHEKPVPGPPKRFAQAMGATTSQIVFKVLLPESLPGVVAGLTITFVSLVGYSAMAGAIGGGGLGDLGIRYGYQRFLPEVMLTVVVILIVFVQLVQSFGDWLVRRLSHK